MTQSIKFVLFAFSIAFSIVRVQAQDEAVNFDRARRQTDTAVRFQALQDFVKQYPSGENLRTANQLLFSTALQLNKNDEALAYAKKYLTLATDRPSTYNEIAWQLAEKGVNLDTALAFIDRGLEEFLTARGRKSAAMLDTKTWVHYKRKEYGNALTTQKEAVALLPEGSAWNPSYDEYYYRLGLCLAAAGKEQKNDAEINQGLSMLARVVLFGVEDGLAALKEFAGEETNTELGPKTQRLIEEAAVEYVQQSPAGIEARSNVAITLAKQNLLLEKALQYANECASLLSQKSSTEQRFASALAQGVVDYYREDYSSALQFLTSAKRFATPYSQDLYLYLGRTYEAQKKLENAFDAYLSGVIAIRPSALMERLAAVHKQLYGENPPEDRSLESLIAAKARDIEHFETEKFSGERSKKTVLAELFTGSECKPCAASDVAYDKLIERYDRSVLAVLEYHLHIPAPDPMTNNDTEARAKYYGVNSTPTSIIDGTDKAIGGGPAVAAMSRFNIYKEDIERRLRETTKAQINLTGSLKKEVVTAKASCSMNPKPASHMVLHVVMAEEGVEYRGVNGISPHRFVMRKMFGSPEGAALNAKGTASINQSANLQSLQDTLKAYLDAFEARYQGNKAFKEKKHVINPDNLFLVAYIQNDATKEVVQSKVIKLTQ